MRTLKKALLAALAIGMMVAVGCSGGDAPSPTPCSSGLSSLAFTDWDGYVIEQRPTCRSSDDYEYGYDIGYDDGFTGKECDSTNIHPNEVYMVYENYMWNDCAHLGYDEGYDNGARYRPKQVELEVPSHSTHIDWRDDFPSYAMDSYAAMCKFGAHFIAIDLAIGDYRSSLYGWTGAKLYTGWYPSNGTVMEGLRELAGGDTGFLLMEIVRATNVEWAELCQATIDRFITMDFSDVEWAILQYRHIAEPDRNLPNHVGVHLDEWLDKYPDIGWTSGELGQ